MANEVEVGRRHRRPPPALMRAASWAGELLVLLLLLAVDFELGMRLLDPAPGATDIAGALATALVALLVAALALARRWIPIWVTVASALALSLMASLVSAATGSLSLSLTEAAALLVLTAWGVRGETSARGAAAIGAGALVIALSAVLLRAGADATVVLLALLVWGCAIVAGLAGRHLRRQRERTMEDRRRAERMELARELHDVVAHQVSAIVVQSQAAIAVAGRDPDRATEAFAAIESAGTEALSGMRRMVGAIREEPGEDAPLAVPYGLGDIPALVERFDPEGSRATLQLEDGQVPMPPGVGETAYRVVREALTNVRRHAPDGTARVRVQVVDAQLVLDISNDGAAAGARGPGSRGFGLTGMAERVAALGGTMRAGGEGPDGWRVRVAVPLERVR